MRYLLIGLLNTIYGIMVLSIISQDTAGYYLILSISIIITILGIIGLILYIIMVFSIFRATGKPEQIIKGWYQITKSIDIVLVLGLLFRAFILQPFIVDGNSMEPNFYNNEYLLVDQITYRFREPQHGEVIIFRPPQNVSEDYIKRIIGLPGETVVIEDGQVSVNGHLLSETYLEKNNITQTNLKVFRRTMSPEEYFVMGDNREHSSDSREWGLVPRKNIVGRAWFAVYPKSHFGLIDNPKINIFENIPPQKSVLAPFEIQKSLKYSLTCLSLTATKSS